MQNVYALCFNTKILSEFETAIECTTKNIDYKKMFGIIQTFPFIVQNVYQTFAKVYKKIHTCLMNFMHFAIIKKYQNSILQFDALQTNMNLIYIKIFEIIQIFLFILQNVY